VNVPAELGDSSPRRSATRGTGRSPLRRTCPGPPAPAFRCRVDRTDFQIVLAWSTIGKRVAAALCGRCTVAVFGRHAQQVVEDDGAFHELTPRQNPFVLHLLQTRADRGPAYSRDGHAAPKAGRVLADRIGGHRRQIMTLRDSALPPARQMRLSRSGVTPADAARCRSARKCAQWCRRPACRPVPRRPAAAADRPVRSCRRQDSR
jgi:hypothetical protein